MGMAAYGPLVLDGDNDSHLFPFASAPRPNRRVNRTRYGVPAYAGQLPLSLGPGPGPCIAAAPFRRRPSGIGADPVRQHLPRDPTATSLLRVSSATRQHSDAHRWRSRRANRPSIAATSQRNAIVARLSASASRSASSRQRRLPRAILPRYVHVVWIGLRCSHAFLSCGWCAVKPLPTGPGSVVLPTGRAYLNHRVRRRSGRPFRRLNSTLASHCATGSRSRTGRRITRAAGFPCCLPAGASASSPPAGNHRTSAPHRACRPLSSAFGCSVMRQQPRSATRCGPRTPGDRSRCRGPRRRVLHVHFGHRLPGRSGAKARSVALQRSPVPTQLQSLQLFGAPSGWRPAERFR